MILCSNEMTKKQLEERCNGDACGCADNDTECVCENCENRKE